jgi:uncharacterized protein
MRNKILNTRLLSFRLSIAFFMLSQRCPAQTNDTNENRGKFKPIETVIKTDDTKKLIAAMGTEETLKRIVPQLINQLKQAMPQAPESYWRELQANLDFKQLIDDVYVPIYEKYFSDEEIKAMTQYYESPLGKKFIATLPKATEEAMLAATEWSRRLAERVSKQLQARQTNAPPHTFHLSSSEKAIILKRRGLDPAQYDISEDGSILPKPQVEDQPLPEIKSAPAQSLPADVKYFITVDKTDGKSEVYLSKLEPKAFGNGFKFRSYPDDAEIIVSGNVTVRKLNSN